MLQKLLLASVDLGSGIDSRHRTWECESELFLLANDLDARSR